MKTLINKILNVFGYKINENNYLKMHMVQFTNESWCNTMNKQGRLYAYMTSK